MPNTEAIIYLSENRKCFQKDTFRSYETVLNLDSESPLKSIIRFFDNTLSAQNSQQILADDFVVVVLIPLVGAIEVVAHNHEKIINSGEIAYVSIKPYEEISVQNPYESELVNYLEIWTKSESRLEERIFCKRFNLDINRNEMIDISHVNITTKIFIGKFDGREAGVFSPIVNQAFVFVINGVFECKNCLIESRSALSIWDIDEFDFEGLGRENIVLIIVPI
jgi:quercetin 2,3-dioxygenase